MLLIHRTSGREGEFDSMRKRQFLIDTESIRCEDIATSDSSKSHSPAVRTVSFAGSQASGRNKSTHSSKMWSSWFRSTKQSGKSPAILDSGNRDAHPSSLHATCLCAHRCANDAATALQRAFRLWHPFKESNHRNTRHGVLPSPPAPFCVKQGVDPQEQDAL